MGLLKGSFPRPSKFTISVAESVGALTSSCCPSLTNAVCTVNTLIIHLHKECIKELNRQLRQDLLAIGAHGMNCYEQAQTRAW